MAKTEKEQIKELEKKIKKLEAMVQTQKQLIDVLKTLPSNKGVKIHDGKRVEKKSKVSSGANKKSRSMAAKVTTRESEAGIRDVGGDTKNTEVMETPSEE